LAGLISVSAVVVEAEAITVAERASSLTMSPDHLEGDHPHRSAVEKQVPYAIYCRQAQAASVTAVDLQLAERHGGDCEDVEAFAEPPTPDDQSTLPNGEVELVLSARRILWRPLLVSWPFCSRTKKAVPSKYGNSFSVYALSREALLARDGHRFFETNFNRL
jgi:hypothetical protein